MASDRWEEEAREIVIADVVRADGGIPLLAAKLRRAHAEGRREALEKVTCRHCGATGHDDTGEKPGLLCDPDHLRARVLAASEDVSVPTGFDTPVDERVLKGEAGWSPRQQSQQDAFDDGFSAGRRRGRREALEEASEACAARASVADGLRDAAADVVVASIWVHVAIEARACMAAVRALMDKAPGGEA
jgi:hypothetical protein